MTVRCPYRKDWWLIQPIAARPPRTSARPRCGRRRPARTLSRVVFPAPLGPNTARVCPASSRNEMSSSARTEPKTCVRPSADSIDAGGEVVQVEGFDEIAAVLQVQDAHERLHARVGGRDDHRERGALRTDLLEQGDAVGIGEPHVEHEDVGGERVELLHGVRAAARERHGVAPGEVAAIGGLQGLFVFDEQDFALRSFIGHRGSIYAPGCYAAPLSNSNKSSSLVRTSRNRSSSLAPRRHTTCRRSAALRWISIRAPSPALSTVRVSRLRASGAARIFSVWRSDITTRFSSKKGSTSPLPNADSVPYN